MSALHLKPASLITKVAINGKDVSFFTPPHSEPDFPWVDVAELASAVCHGDEAALLANAAYLYRPGGHRTSATAVDGSRICAIICHAQAQGLMGAIDQLHGFEKDDVRPAFDAYCFAAWEIVRTHCQYGLTDLLKAYSNVGGPFLRSAEAA